MKTWFTVIVCVLMFVVCTSTQAQEVPGTDYVAQQLQLMAEQVIVQAENASLSAAAFLLEQTAAPSADEDDLCEYYRKKFDQYDALIAATYLTLLQNDKAVSDALAEVRFAEEFLRAQSALLQLMLQRGNYTQEQIAEQEQAVADAETKLDIAQSKLRIAEDRRRGTEAYLIRISKLRSDAQAYLDEHCGGVSPPAPPVPVPVPDPGF